VKGPAEDHMMKEENNALAASHPIHEAEAAAVMAE